MAGRGMKGEDGRVDEQNQVRGRSPPTSDAISWCHRPSGRRRFRARVLLRSPFPLRGGAIHSPSS
eukprot:6895477-Pyramimonas_sp.AAC.1